MDIRNSCTRRSFISSTFFKDTLNSKIGIGAHIQEVQAIFKDIFNLEKEFLPNGNQFDHLFQENEILKIGSMEIRILHTPGHTPADIAYIINERAAFVGDTLFMPDIGTARCDFPGGDAGQLYDSIKNIALK
ncbi:MBL fold metallo-hydrolase [Acinetobacter sp. HC8-3S]